MAELKKYGEEVFYDFLPDEDRYTLTLQAQNYEKLQKYKEASTSYARAVRLAVRDLGFLQDQESKLHTREIIDKLIKNSRINWSLSRGEIPDGWDIPLQEGVSFNGNVSKNKYNKLYNNRYRFFNFDITDNMTIKIELDVIEGDGDLFVCNVVHHPTSNSFTWASVGDGSDTIEIPCKYYFIIYLVIHIFVLENIMFQYLDQLIQSILLKYN